MNLQFILWIAGLFATWIGLKFVFLLFKRLGSKSALNDVIDRVEDGMADAADKVAGAWKSRRRKEERVKVTIR